MFKGLRSRNVPRRLIHTAQLQDFGFTIPFSLLSLTVVHHSTRPKLAPPVCTLNLSQTPNIEFNSQTNIATNAPMMLTPLHTPPAGPSWGCQAYYGHQKVITTRCGHEVHPASSRRTPWCPACTASHAKAKLDAAQKKLVAGGGLTPPEHMRDRRWNIARLKHNIAKQRIEKSRREDQLRWEREQAWDEAHERYDSQRAQAAADFKSLAECPVCASTVASYPNAVPNAQIAKDVSWWERPSAPVVEFSSRPLTPPQSRYQRRKREPEGSGSKALRQIIQNLRASVAAADADRRAWELRGRIESGVRRKHSLGEDFQVNPDFWESPIHGLFSLRSYQQAQDSKRLAERRARGNMSRPLPPRSSLSYSEVAEELEVEQGWAETLAQKEEKEELEREARKVAEEVGYLYFVGLADATETWKDDYLRSDRQLVVRTHVTNSETSGSENEDDDADDDVDEMDIDEP